MTPRILSMAEAPSVNGVPLALVGETLSDDALRQRAHQELLRQAAIAAGLLPADDAVPLHGIPSEAASNAIEALLAQALPMPPADDVAEAEAAERRFHAAHAARFAQGERLRLRHVLFAVTPGVDIHALRQRAEACLVDLRARTRAEIDGAVAGAADRFAEAARTLSNCPSGQDGGQLGWLAAPEVAPEFARELFGRQDIGVLPQLVHSRFGLHVVEVLAREPGTVPPFEAVQGAVRQAMAQQTFAAALRQYLAVLAGEAELRGVPLDAAQSPLVQ